MLQMYFLIGFNIQKIVSGVLSKTGKSLPDIYQIIYNVGNHTKTMKTKKNIKLEKHQQQLLRLSMQHNPQNFV